MSEEKLSSPRIKKLEETHDFRDRGDPLEKVHPDPQHWSRWPERDDVDLPVPRV